MQWWIFATSKKYYNLLVSIWNWREYCWRYQFLVESSWRFCACASVFVDHIQTGKESIHLGFVRRIYLGSLPRIGKEFRVWWARTFWLRCRFWFRYRADDATIIVCQTASMPRTMLAHTHHSLPNICVITVPDAFIISASCHKSTDMLTDHGNGEFLEGKA